MFFRIVIWFYEFYRSLFHKFQVDLINWHDTCFLYYCNQKNALYIRNQYKMKPRKTKKLTFTKQKED